MAVNVFAVNGTIPAAAARHLLLTSAMAPAASGLGPRPGVVVGVPTALQVGVSSGMTVAVQAGIAIVAGYVVVVDATTTKTLDPSTATARWDVVGLRVYDQEAGDAAPSRAEVWVVKGTTTAEAAFPARFIPLARVVVGASVSSINAGNFTDRRSYTAAAGGTIPIPGALSMSPNTANVAVGQKVWDATSDGGVELVAVSGTTWMATSRRARYWQAVVTDSAILVGVSTSTTVLTVNLPADAPPGAYRLESDMISRSDAAASTYVQVVAGGADQFGGSLPTDNPANQDVSRSLRHTWTHSLGGSTTVILRLQINGGSAAWNRARHGTSLCVTFLGRV